jgi:hypothetical protein
MSFAPKLEALVERGLAHRFHLVEAMTTVVLDELKSESQERAKWGFDTCVVRMKNIRFREDMQMTCSMRKEFTENLSSKIQSTGFRQIEVPESLVRERGIVDFVTFAHSDMPFKVRISSFPSADDGGEIRTFCTEPMMDPILRAVFQDAQVISTPSLQNIPSPVEPRQKKARLRDFVEFDLIMCVTWSAPVPSPGFQEGRADTLRPQN